MARFGDSTGDSTGPRFPAFLAHLSEGTVRNYLSSAIRKLGARNRAEAVQIAEEKGWLEGPRRNSLP
jgi:hypothetical protein